jgi:nitrate/nitrite transporter NarK
MQVSDIFRFRNAEIKALHLTWIAFFICFYVWFNMAPLASSMLASVDWLTRDDLRLFAIANVALTIPARIIVGMVLDKCGPRRVFSVLMVAMAIPTFVFAFAPIPAMSMVSYAAGSRYLSLLRGTCMSFYDWYCDLPPASPMTWGEQTMT